MTFIAKNLVFETSFVVMPADCNYMMPMIFGGAFCAASAVSRVLHNSPCDAAVTHKFEGTYHAAANLGDLIFLRAEIVELRRKAIVIKVRAEREKRAIPGRDLVADATFVFVSKKDGEFCHHLLEMPKEKE